MDQIEPALWKLLVLFLEVFGPIVFIVLGLLARKYLKGKARLVYLLGERQAEAHLTTLLRQSIDYADEQAYKAKLDRKEEGIDKLGIATDAAIVLLKNSSLPQIGQKRLRELIEQELGASRTVPVFTNGHEVLHVDENGITSVPI